MDIIPSDFTDDEFEQNLLAMTELDTLEPDNPLFVELHQISNQLSNLRMLLSPLQRKIFPYLANPNMTNLDIAAKLDCSSQTVSKARGNPSVRRMLGLVEHSQRLHSGPSTAERLQMLWQIAKREQTAKPSVAIKAVDTINKQLGDYTPQEVTTGGVVVNINEFKVVNTAGETPQPVANMTRQHKNNTEGAVDAVFTPLTVDVDPAP